MLRGGKYGRRIEIDNVIAYVGAERFWNGFILPSFQELFDTADYNLSLKKETYVTLPNLNLLNKLTEKAGTLAAANEVEKMESEYHASFDQVLDCILNNLCVGPKIIEDTTKGFLIKDHLKSKIDLLEVDFEKVRFWYTLDNFENKHDLIWIKVNIGNGQISLSRFNAVPIPTTAVKDIYKRIREATQLSNKLIQDKYSSNKLASFDVKLSIISG